MPEVSHVNRDCSGKKALQDFSCVLGPDEVYGLLGANNSGKTTLMKLIVNLILPDSGEILLNGTPVSAVSRAHIVYMPAEPYFYPYMKIEDVGEYYRNSFTDLSQETYHRVLDAFQLNPSLHVESLSSGMIAKVKVAVTMSRKADVILLDKPSSGIDLIACDQVMDLIILRVEHEPALLPSSYLVEKMERLISKAISVKDGNTIADFDVEELHVEEGLSFAEKYCQLLA